MRHFGLLRAKNFLTFITIFDVHRITSLFAAKMEEIVIENIPVSSNGEPVVLLDLDPDSKEMKDLRNGGTIEIETCPEVRVTSSSSSSPDDDQKDKTFQPDDEEENSEDDFAPQGYLSRIDGRKKWNGSKRRALSDDDFASRMEEIHRYLLHGKIPFFETRQQKNKFLFQARHKYSLDSGGRLMMNKVGKGGAVSKLEVVWDVQKQLDILKSCHGGAGSTNESKALGGHLGVNTVRNIVAARFHWPRLYETVKKFIKSCEQCQRNNITCLEKAKQTLNPVPVPTAIWQQIGIDLMGPLPESPEGHLYVMTAVDYFSKWVEMFPLKSKTAIEIGEKLYQLMCRYGPAKVHITDQGREFVNQVSRHLYSLSGQNHRITGAYHPQANGLCERQNQSTINALRKMVGDREGDWYKMLDATAYSFRATPRRATGGRSPFEIMFGRPMGLPVDLRHEEGEDRDIDEDDVQAVEKVTLENGEEDAMDEIFNSAMKMRQEMFALVEESIKTEQHKYKDYYDAIHDTEKELEVGTKVLRRNLVHKGRMGGKIDYQFMGPYTIVDVDKKKSSYRLADKKGNLYGQRVNASNLKLYTERKKVFPKANLEEAEPVLKSRCAPRKKKKKTATQSSQGSQSSLPSTQESNNESNHDSQEVPDSSDHVEKVPLSQASSEGNPDVTEADVTEALDQMHQQGLLKILLNRAHKYEQGRRPGEVDLNLMSLLTDKGKFILDNFPMTLHEGSHCTQYADMHVKQADLSTYKLMVASEVGELVNPTLPLLDVKEEEEEKSKPDPEPQHDADPQQSEPDPISLEELLKQHEPVSPVDLTMPVFSAQKRKAESVKKSVSFADGTLSPPPKRNKLSKTNRNKRKNPSVYKRLDVMKDQQFKSWNGVEYSQGEDPNESYVTCLAVEQAQEYPFIPAGSAVVRDRYANRLCSGLGKSSKKGPLKFKHNKAKMTKTHITRKIMGDSNCLF